MDTLHDYILPSMLSRPPQPRDPVGELMDWHARAKRDTWWHVRGCYLANRMDKIEVLYDYSIIVHGDVCINVGGRGGLTSLECGLNVREVKGDFRLDDPVGARQLTSLVGGPTHSVRGEYSVTRQNLSDLTGAPKDYVGSMFCDDNNLRSLSGAPKGVGVRFSCRGNQLKSLEGCPTSVQVLDVCGNTMLRSLKGFPALCHLFKSRLFSYYFDWDEEEPLDYMPIMNTGYDVATDPGYARWLLRSWAKITEADPSKVTSVPKWALDKLMPKVARAVDSGIMD